MSQTPRLWVRILPLLAGTAEPAGQPDVLPCSADVEPDTILSFLSSRLGDPVETAWTSTDRHPRLPAGWIFPTRQTDPPGDPKELLCVPLIETPGGGLRPMFEALADERQDMEELARTGALRKLTTIELPHRDYQPGDGGRMSAEPES